uniref:Uncharacterized protein n=1 Tax=Oryza glumipatula TaxID=40148 RepID=A0A0E0A6B0_9ORYZ
MTHATTASLLREPSDNVHDEDDYQEEVPPTRRRLDDVHDERQTTPPPRCARRGIVTCSLLPRSPPPPARRRRGRARHCQGDEDKAIVVAPANLPVAGEGDAVDVAGPPWVGLDLALDHVAEPDRHVKGEVIYHGS